jgi:hypothetical protein
MRAFRPIMPTAESRSIRLLGNHLERDGTTENIGACQRGARQRVC